MKVEEKNKESVDQVTWTLHGDAIRPRRVGWGFVVLNPVSTVILPNSSVVIDTGVSASVPLVVHSNKGSVPTVLFPGAKVTVTISNTSHFAPMTVDDREVVAMVSPIVFSGNDQVVSE